MSDYSAGYEWVDVARGGTCTCGRSRWEGDHWEIGDPDRAKLRFPLPNGELCVAVGDYCWGCGDKLLEGYAHHLQ